ncbi:MAG: septum formation initiator family protein [Pseudomonadota bacterium]
MNTDKHERRFGCGVSRWLYRFVLAAALAVAFGLFPYQAYGPKGVGQVGRLREEFQEMVEENVAITHENEILRRRVQLLKSDPKILERVARDELGLVKPEDLVFQFE